MATLSTLLASKFTVLESNLEQGRIWVYANGSEYHTLWCGFCWIAPGPGTVIVEAWGAAGSGARMCCCGYGLPGNAGAYSKKTFTTNTGCTITGCLGMSCGNSGTMCFRGCSTPTMLCWVGATSNGCICAQGGKGGVSFCSTSTAAWCCFYGNSWCGTCLGPGCGIICNYCNSSWIACGYGGDVNCCGGFGCMAYTNCDSGASWICGYTQHIPLSPGLAGDSGAVLVGQPDGDTGSSKWSGQGMTQALHSLNVAGKNSVRGGIWASCWAGAGSCGCYESNGCGTFMPVGVPGAGASPCGEVRDGGVRGGHGAVKITFIG